MKTHLLLFGFLALTGLTSATDRPNIVWILSEDNSIHYLKHFFPGGAEAPHIEALAAEGLTFDHAFSNGPVCSVARTTLATGCYGPRIGTQFHRKYQLATLPPGQRMFMAYLREAGYYTTNNSKQDYNAQPSKEAWDESSNKASWRNRPKADQPFFHMESHGQSHEGSLHFSQAVYENEKTTHDPASVTLAPYHPDTPLFRYTHARYLDRMQEIDGIVGNTVARLEEDGLLEDTFIFYFGDHGGVLPRGKGYIYESGLHVPLVVRVPENWRTSVSAAPGSRLPGFVSFIDFGPTALNLAGTPVPHGMDGRPFLGPGVSLDEVNSRDESFGYADRFDEKYEFIRSLRKGRYQYIRYYQPWLPDGLQNNYRYKMLAFTEWRNLYQAGQLNETQRQFFEPKPVEALFDVEADPHEVHDLAADPAHADTLADLRSRLNAKVRSLPDLSFYPESHLTEHAMTNPVVYGQEHRAEIHALADIADLTLIPFAEAEPKLAEALRSDNHLQRYWGAMVCSAFAHDAGSLVPLVERLVRDPSEVVRIRAAEFLGILGNRNPQPILLDVVNTTGNPVTATEALNSVVHFRDKREGGYPVAIEDIRPANKGADVMDRWNYINGDPYPPRPKKTKKGKKKE